MFLRMVLGDATFERMPCPFHVRATASWPALRADCQALAAYRLRYDQLPAVTVPARLLGGDHSPPYFAQTLEALAARLPHARLSTLVGAGHMMHAQARRAFLREVTQFADELAAL